MPLHMYLALTPPSSVRKTAALVYSPYHSVGLVGSIAVDPPSPPNHCHQPFPIRWSASVPLSCVPPTNKPPAAEDAAPDQNCTAFRPLLRLLQPDTVVVARMLVARYTPPSSATYTRAFPAPS